MTPSEVRNELVAIQEKLRELENTIHRQKSANVVYHEVNHEMTEAWDALENAIEFLDEVVMGIT